MIIKNEFIFHLPAQRGIILNLKYYLERNSDLQCTAKKGSTIIANFYFDIFLQCLYEVNFNIEWLFNV